MERTALSSRKLALSVAAALVVAGVAAYATIPDASGVIHGCYDATTGRLRLVDGTSCKPTELPISWNQAGPTGPQGPSGPPGPAGGGGGNAFYTEDRSPVEVPTDYMSVLSISLAPGKYQVTASVLANNLGADRVPINCLLEGGNNNSTIAAAQLEGNGGASGVTLSLSYLTELFEPGTVDLRCVSNTGPGGATAIVEQRQITGVTVNSITMQ